MQTRFRFAPSAVRALLPAMAAVLCAAAPRAAMAEDLVLAHASGEPQAMEYAGKDADEGGTGHIVTFEAPRGWHLTFARELSFWGKRTGLGQAMLGNILIWEDNPPVEDEDPKDHIPYRTVLQQNFSLADVPEAGGWVKVPLQATALPRKFYVGVYCYGTTDASVLVGLGPKARTKSRSGILYPLEMGPGGTGIEFRRDGREWLISLAVTDSLSAGDMVKPSDLSGPGFAAWDDGSADGFDTMQKCGAMVKFHTDAQRKVKRVWVYAKLEGEWYQTQRRAGCWIMNDRLGILNRQDLPYASFTSAADWAGVDFPSIAVSGDYYVLVEPVSRPQLGLLIGYDSSGENMGSLYGDAGAVQTWECKAPEESANWMIRVEYE